MTGQKCYKFCKKFKNCRISRPYLEPPWEIHWFKYKHTRYWFINLWNSRSKFQKCENANTILLSKTNARRIRSVKILKETPSIDRLSQFRQALFGWSIFPCMCATHLQYPGTYAGEKPFTAEYHRKHDKRQDSTFNLLLTIWWSNRSFISSLYQALKGVHFFSILI